MGWIRLDDRFAEHPKILELTDRELRVHVNALCYTARAQDPHITPAALRVLGATARQARRLAEVGVWDVNDNGWVIHDWDDYQRQMTADPMTNAERQAALRARRRVTKTVTESNDGSNE